MILEFGWKFFYMVVSLFSLVQSSRLLPPSSKSFPEIFYVFYCTTRFSFIFQYIESAKVLLNNEEHREKKLFSLNLWCRSWISNIKFINSLNCLNFLLFMLQVCGKMSLTSTFLDNRNPKFWPFKILIFYSTIYKYKCV